MDDRRWNAVTVVTKLGHKDLIDLYMHDKVTRQEMCKRLLDGFGEKNAEISEQKASGSPLKQSPREEEQEQDLKARKIFPIRTCSSLIHFLLCRTV